jgi:hypothetical protein
MKRYATGVGLSLLCSGALAAGASAATLKVSVPGHLHKGDHYAIKLSGSYQKSELSGRAYLISLIQFSGKPCKATAQLENSQVNSNLLQFYFAPQKSPQNVGIFETHSPFTRTDGFVAGRLGSRRVCAYLYPKFIAPGSTVKPIASAGKAYSVAKKK